MTELLDTNTLIKRLRYQGRQYAAGQASRGGNSGPHMLEQAADQLEIALAEGDALRAKLDELAKQEHAAFVNEQGFIVERDDMQISSGEKLYLAAGARPVEVVPADGWLHSSGMAEHACREIEVLRAKLDELEEQIEMENSKKEPT